MKYVRLLAVAIIAVWNCDSVRAAEVTLIAPGGIRAAVDQMIPYFERATGHKVKATFGSGGGTKDRVLQGEPFDVPIVQLPLEHVIVSGHVVAASETPLATVSVSVAVRTGAPKPDISTADAVKRLLLESKAISFPNAASGAAAGMSFNETLQKLGIADAMKPKIKIAQGGRGAMELLAKGEVDIGLTFISEIITDPGSRSSAHCRETFRLRRLWWALCPRIRRNPRPRRRSCAICLHPRPPQSTSSAGCSRVAEQSIWRLAKE